MSAPDARFVVAREWIAKAEQDLLAAVHLLKMGDGCPAGTVCFHAQQCAEKYMKALLVVADVSFPKTHDLERVASMLPAELGVVLLEADLSVLTEYAVSVRYPGTEEPTRSEARAALATARRIRKACRRALPRPLLRPARSGFSG